MIDDPENVWEMNYNDLGYTYVSEQGYRAVLDAIISNCEIEESQITKRWRYSDHLTIKGVINIPEEMRLVKTKITQ